MRKLSEEEQNTKIETVRNTIKKSKLLFKEDDWAVVISGRDEGIYGWVSVNYLKTILNKNSNEGKITEKTFGVIDCGGSSIEMTFLPETKTNNDFENDISDIPLGGITYSLYSHVYDNYGQDDSYEKLFKILIKDKDSNERLSHPCLPKGFNKTYNNSGTVYNFDGDYNMESCLNLTKEILNITDCVNIEDSDSTICSMNGVKQPKFNEDQKFYGMSSLAYLSDGLGLDNTKYRSPKEILNYTIDYCNKGASKIKEENPKTDDKYLKIYCYSGHYYYNMLVYGLGFNENWSNLILSNKINNTDTGWSFGSMIYEVGSLEN